MAILLLLAIVILLPLTLLAVVPVSFALTQMGSLLSLPGHLLAVALDPRRRRNHALEHATVNVLEQRFGARIPLSGFAESDSFVLTGPANPEVVLAAAREGLERLQAGERRLALHPRCATVIVSGQAIAVVTFIVVLLFMKVTAGGVILALLAALFAARGLARPLGLFLERAFTTTTDVAGMHIDRLDAELPSQPFAILLSGGQPTRFRVWTHSVQVESPITEQKRYRAY